MKDVFYTRGGGTVFVEQSTFHANDNVFKLDDSVIGHASRNIVDGAMFGRWLRPPGFTLRGNTYTSVDTGTDEEEDQLEWQ